ncbi:MAG TPA: PfkB family carbohydrate kinase [Rhodothermales bacterium]
MIEAAVLGRVGVDLYPEQLETPLSEVETFRRYVGGFAGNVATGLARLGVDAAIVSRVGADGHGVFIRRWLAEQGVDVRFLGVDPYWQTPPTFCEIWPPDRFPITFYRKPTAPDWRLEAEDFDQEEVADARILYATATALAQSPSRETTLGALRAHRGVTIFDLDWRPDLWDDVAAFPVVVRDAVAASDVVIGNEEEVAAASLPEVATLVLKRGERGATVFEDGQCTDVEGRVVTVLNGLGAGDAFAAALGESLLRGRSLVEAVRRGTIAGAIVASRVACSAAMPTASELQSALDP